MLSVISLDLTIVLHSKQVWPKGDGRNFTRPLDLFNHARGQSESKCVRALVVEDDSRAAAVLIGSTKLPYPLRDRTNYNKTWIDARFVNLYTVNMISHTDIVKIFYV